MKETFRFIYSVFKLSIWIDFIVQIRIKLVNLDKLLYRDFNQLRRKRLNDTNPLSKSQFYPIKKKI